MDLEHYFSFVILTIILSFDTTMADGSLCNCRCQNRSYICDDLKGLRTEVDVNTADRRKWNRHFQFVQKFHYTWEEEIANVLNQQMKNLPRNPKSSSEYAKMKEMNLKSEEQYLELQKKMSDVEERLRTSMDRTERLEFDLRNEKEASNLFMSEYRRRELLLQTQNLELTNKFLILGENLRLLESTVKKLQSDLAKEMETRNQMKDEDEEIQLKVRVPANYTRHMMELESNLSGLGEQLGGLRNKEMLNEYEIYKEKNIRKKLQSSISKMQSAALKVSDALRPVVPSSVADNLTREISMMMDDSEIDTEDWTTNVTNPNSVLHPLKSTTGTLRSNPYIEVSSKLEDLEAKMRILNDSIGKAVSNIKVLENKQKAASRNEIRPKASKGSGRRGFEFIKPHDKPANRRPFDPVWDP